MKKIIFISDFFLEDGVAGGAEQFNNNLIVSLSEKYNLIKINSKNVTGETVLSHRDAFFIVSNFMMLPEGCKTLIGKTEYIILEHDHKYVKNNDPSKFIGMLAPQEALQNKRFFKEAKAVLCQSKIHSEVLQKNLLLENIVNLSCNLWSDDQLALLETASNRKKTIDFSIIDSNNLNKGTSAAINYCKKNEIKFNRLGWMPYEEFLGQLSATKTLIFFPQWLESFNRLVVEAKILGCEILTNKLIGVASEEWFLKASPSEIIPILRNKRKEVLDIFFNLIEGNLGDIFFLPSIKIPKVSIITSLYKGGKFIESFMKNITNQTAFKDCELVILDAASPDNEYENCIEKYLKKHDNIRYTRLSSRMNVQQTMNLGIQISQGEFLTLANVDDLRHPDHIRILASSLVVDPTIDLVYADCLETTAIEEEFTPEKKKKYEHSNNQFSPENMIKCLPGPMPVWRKSLHDNVGDFNEKLEYAGDWDLWLRAVRTGSKFKKIQEILGLYYVNPQGLSTSPANLGARFAEEKSIFNANKDIFGEGVSSRFEKYFNGR